MKDQQIKFYAATPILYWPWLWLQFWRLDRWMAERRIDGEIGGVMLHLGPRGTLTMTFMSDNLNDDLEQTFTPLSVADLTAIYFPDWMYTVARTFASPRISGDTSRAFTSHEIADALIPIP